jgi:hypothetical protein
MADPLGGALDFQAVSVRRAGVRRCEFSEKSYSPSTGGPTPMTAGGLMRIEGERVTLRCAIPHHGEDLAAVGGYAR